MKLVVPLVGIGASAGGLKTLQDFFEEISPKTGMAFAVVVHLAPDRESVAAKLLQSHTEMPVRQVTKEEELKADHVYVIPPGMCLRTVGPRIRVDEHAGNIERHMPVDILFRAIAKSHGENAIGVILTGTGMDGTLGLAAIKEYGGFTFVQDPKEAEFDGMSRNALSYGKVDLCLPVKEIAKHIGVMRGIQPNVPIPREDEIPSGHALKILDGIFFELRSRSGHDFSNYTLSTVFRRIRRRMLLCQLADMGEYLKLLRESGEEARSLFEDLLITVTRFFRDEEVFNYLGENVIPKLFEGKTGKDKIRIWTIGCATGEEAYSLAMIILKHRSTLKDAPEVQIFASDLHEKSLVKAREGLYPESIRQDIPEQYLRRYFVSQKGGFQVTRDLRETIIFTTHNILRDSPFSNLDLISCRNLLIYLQPNIQKEVTRLFHYSLKPGGILLLGSSETVKDGAPFEMTNSAYSIYRKQNVQAKYPQLPLLKGGWFSFDQKWEKDFSSQRRISHYGILHQKIVEEYAPPSILVAKNFEIVHYSERAGQFLQQPGGEPTNNVFKRIREEFRYALSGLFQSVSNNESTVNSKPTKMVIDGVEKKMILRMYRVEHSPEDLNYLIIFDDAIAIDGQTVESDVNLEEEPISNRSKRELEMELSLTRKRLQTSIENYERSQEEMRSGSEELQSANEELLSTLEELETSKEELQSINEELVSVNKENKAKVNELSILASDLQNLLSATDVATIFLDSDLKIMRFTPRISEIFNIQTIDHGRNISNFTHILRYNDLEKDSRKVLESHQPLEMKVQSAENTWFLMRILPYRTVNEKIDGVVITLFDITDLKNNEDDLRKSENQLKRLTEELEERVQKRSRQVEILASRLTLAEQRERDRIAQILHDELQQMICSVQMKLYLSSRKNNISTEDFEGMDNFLKEAIDMTRRLTVDLSPPVLADEGLKEVLLWLKSQMKKMHGLEVKIVSEDSCVIRNKGIRVTLFQIIRELLFNVVKHAQAHEATVELRRKGEKLEITVADNGSGFDVEILKKNKDNGFGLKTMAERLKLFGGKVNFRSNSEDGTVVHVLIPESSCEFSTGEDA